MVRFLHTSDWQIGMSRAFLAGEAQSRFAQARIDAVRTIANVARDESCAFVVVAGDVFEHHFVEEATLSRTLDALASIPVPVYLLPGNHDPLSPGGAWEREPVLSSAPANVIVLRGGVTLAPGDIEIISAPWHSKAPSADLAAEALEPFEGAPGRRILVAHGAVETFAASRNDPSIINEGILRRALAAGIVSYVALGDRHSTFEVLPGCWYSGAPEPTAFDERDPGKVLVVEINGGACDVRPVRTGAWSFVELTAELRDDHAVRDFLTRIDALPDRQRTALRLTYAGILSFESAAALERELDRREPLFAGFDRKPSLVARPTPEELEAMPIGGYLREAAETLRARAAESGPAARDAEEALLLLYRLGGQPA